MEIKYEITYSNETDEETLQFSSLEEAVETKFMLHDEGYEVSEIKKIRV